jgi:transcriptional regulator of acetoin/glycerol metabolism
MRIGAARPAEAQAAFSAKATREITRAWETFLSSGELSSSSLRPLIAERWRRSHELGIDPRMQRAPTALEPGEIEAILAREDLGRAGRTVLEDFGRVVEGTGHVVVLADPEGRILHAVGHSRVHALMERVNLAPGAVWSEAAVGPNGIGTPLALGQPEMVFGPEHYCEGWQSFFCCGFPIRDPTRGWILGAVDITGPLNKAHPAKALALTFSIARCVEGNLRVLGLERGNALNRTFRERERRWPAEPLLLVDDTGKVVDLNPPAARALGLPPVLSPNQIAALAPQLSSRVRTPPASGEAHEETLLLSCADGRARTVDGRIEPVMLDGRAVGSVVVVSLRRARTPAGRAAARRIDGPAVGGQVLRPRYTFADILGESPALQEAIRLARAVARGPGLKPVMIVGESGTGKEVIAHAIHSESDRADRPFVAVNCGALPRELVESELFGYASGAFTGARREGQAGKFEAAQGGTVFLDEVDSMPLEVQAKLLRVIDTNEVVRLGNARPIGLDVAILAASGVDARRRVEEGAFRLDLFHRLSVVEIFMPPLRERRGDIALLTSVFLDRECAASGREPLALSGEAADLVAAYNWPGNIRELQNLCARWSITVTGGEVRAEDFPAHLRGSAGPRPEGASRETLRGKQDTIIRQTLLETGGHVAEAARRLAINKTTIYRRMKRWRSRDGSCSVQ